MLNDLRIEKLTRAGIALMQKERDMAVRGDLDGLARIEGDKSLFLEQMEEIAEKLAQGGPQMIREDRKKELSALFNIVRRRAEENQYLLRAAKAGVKAAKRQIDALDEASAILGVYAADGKQMNAAAYAKPGNLC
ncbi:MAG: hypothetical protein MRY63_10685 [Neomegalonema sp.]|nr:hypothetical protein [Neomegalonema sp.]